MASPWLATVGAHWRAVLGGGLISLALLLGLVWLVGADQVFGQTLLQPAGPMALHDGQSLGQTMIVPGDGLRRIDLYFSTRRRLRAGPVTIKLSDQAGRLLVERTVDSAELSERWQSFEFPPLTGLTSHWLRLDVERDVSPRAAIWLWLGPGTAYADGQGIYQADFDPSFDLVFRAYVATPPAWPARWAQVGRVMAAVSDGRPGPFGQPVWLTGLGVTYGLGLAMLLLLLVGLWRRPAR